MKLFILAILVACLIPIVPTTYEIVRWEQVEEQYTITEPYTITEEIKQPYTGSAEVAEWVDDGSWDRAKNYVAFTVDEYMEVFRSVTPGKWVIKQYPVTEYRTVKQSVVRYHEVTKTRLVSQPITVQQTRLVSIMELVIRH